MLDNTEFVWVMSDMSVVCSLRVTSSTDVVCGSSVTLSVLSKSTDVCVVMGAGRR